MCCRYIYVWMLTVVTLRCQVNIHLACAYGQFEKGIGFHRGTIFFLEGDQSRERGGGGEFRRFCYRRHDRGLLGGQRIGTRRGWVLISQRNQRSVNSRSQRPRCCKSRIANLFRVAHLLIEIHDRYCTRSFPLPSSQSVISLSRYLYGNIYLVFRIALIDEKSVAVQSSQ